MRKVSFLLLLFLCLFSIRILSQPHYLEWYDGIPIIAHTNSSSGSIASDNARMDKMLELGIYGFYASDLSTDRYNSIKGKGLKMFPYQLGQYDNTVRTEVYTYTSGVYSVWEPEGNPQMGNAKIDFNADIAEVAPGGTCVKTKSGILGPGNFIYGPYYYQYINYKGTGTPISYDASFQLKLEREEEEPLPSGYEEAEVCTLKVTAYNLALDSEKTVTTPLVLKVKDFRNNPSNPNDPIWGNWKKHDVNYDLTSLNNLSDEEIKGPLRILGQNEFTSQFMQYKIDFNGLPYLNLYVDTILVSDDRGRKLYTDEDVRASIRTCVSQYTDTNYVLGWFGLNEPFSIDNYLCFREVNNLVHEVNPRLDLYTTFTAGCAGRYYWDSCYKGVNATDIYPGYEFYKKSNLNFLSINLYNYNYPYDSTGSEYYLKDIDYVTDTNLAKINSNNIPFSYSTQSGKFYKWELEGGQCVDKYWNFVKPTNAQMIYHINLGLLYGAKELTIDPLFTLYYTGGDCNGEMYRDGLIDQNNSLTSLGAEFKAKIKPRFSGLLGKTIKHLNPWDIYTNQQTSYMPPLDKNYIYKIYDYPILDGGGTTVDVAFFEDTADYNKKYFMIINRYYNSNEIFNLVLQDLSGYRNWELTDYVDTTKNTYESSGPYDRLDFSTTITPGDCRFFSILPVVKYGGNLIYSETISTQESLLDKLTIHAGDTLTINSTYNLNDTVVVDSGGTLVINSGAVVNVISGTIINNGTIDINGGTLKFNQGLGLKNNRTMYADNALITAYDQSWGSIIFDGSAASNSIIDSTEIRYASDIQCLNSANVTIQNSVIRNCTEGIYIYNSEPNIIANQIIDPLYNGINAVSAGDEIEIYDNVIIKNSNNPQYKQYQGIYFQSYSQGYITHNDISGFYWGMYIGGGSGGYFVDYYGETPVPNNRMDTCSNGIGVGWGSYCLAGEYEYGGYNTIMDNTTYDAKVYQSSSMFAQYNYWGGEEGNNYVDGSSELYDDYYLEADPWKGSFRNITAGIEIPDKGTNNKLLKGTGSSDIVTGLELERSNSITEAVNYYMQMVSSDTYPVFALTRLAVIKKKHNISGIHSYFISLLDGSRPYKPVVLNLLASLSLKDDNYNQAITFYNAIIQGYPNSSASVNARFEKFFAALCYAKDGNAATQILFEIQALNLNDEEYLMRLETAEYLLERFNNSSQNFIKSQRVTSEVDLPKEYGLYQNYPNPFNPLTTIRYDLPKDSKVSLVIYDITGREVRTIISKEQKEGRYEVQFNGSSLASGIYFYRLQAGEYVKVQKMSLIK